MVTFPCSLGHPLRAQVPLAVFLQTAALASLAEKRRLGTTPSPTPHSNSPPSDSPWASSTSVNAAGPLCGDPSGDCVGQRLGYCTEGGLQQGVTKRLAEEVEGETERMARYFRCFKRQYRVSGQEGMGRYGYW